MSPDHGAWVYILRCADGSFYVGVTGGLQDVRVARHDAGEGGTYTAIRRPVRLAFAQSFQRIEDAIRAEKQIKGWSRAKKLALIDGRYEMLSGLAARGFNPSGSGANEQAGRSNLPGGTRSHRRVSE